MKNNTGKDNSGNRNSGDYNSGHYNSGNRNSGYGNSGNRNSGDWNSGDGNSGNRNSGHYNSGHYNSGHYNSGHYNSGYGNSGNRNSGYFNTNTPKIRLFNEYTDLELKDIVIPYLYLPVNEWVSEENMTDSQKKSDPNFFVKKGTLISLSYKDAWKVAWDKADKTIKDQFLNLPNFNADIFLEITGIDTRKKEDTCSGKIVTIDGKKYKLSEV